MGSRRRFLSAAAGFVAGTVTVGSASAAEQNLVTLLHGSRAPKQSLGVVGDFYIESSTHSIYGPKRKAAFGGWGKPTRLVGPAGAAGTSSGGSSTTATGEVGPEGPRGYSVLHGDGPPGASTGEDNDFYIDTTTTQLYGPREGGVWGSPVSLSGTANISVIDGGTL